MKIKKWKSRWKILNDNMGETVLKTVQYINENSVKIRDAMMANPPFAVLPSLQRSSVLHIHVKPFFMSFMVCSTQSFWTSVTPPLKASFLSPSKLMHVRPTTSPYTAAIKKCVFSIGCSFEIYITKIICTCSCPQGYLRNLWSWKFACVIYSSYGRFLEKFFLENQKKNISKKFRKVFFSDSKFFCWRFFLQQQYFSRFFCGWFSFKNIFFTVVGASVASGGGWGRPAKWAVRRRPRTAAEPVPSTRPIV